ncbi:MAG: hypothetical protein ACLFSH_03140 [Phormidium sp.]
MATCDDRRPSLTPRPNPRAPLLQFREIPGQSEIIATDLLGAMS